MPLIGTFGAGSAGGYGQRKGVVKLNDVGIDILLVAGGGGGGTCAVGAGGGGGVVLVPAPNGTELLNLKVANDIVIGGGGAGGDQPANPGLPNGVTGGDTTIDSVAGQIIAKGGGRNDAPGGSGGGPGRGAACVPCNAIQGCQAGVSGTYGFGFGGAAMPPATGNGGTRLAGGAGGASARGSNASGPGGDPVGSAGPGGAGKTVSPTFPGISLGASGVVAGGGGGSVYPYGPNLGAGNGGPGGGGRGASNPTGSATGGTAQTGGGGGSAGVDVQLFNPGASTKGANGGSGVAAFRIPSAYPSVVATPGTNTVTCTPCGSKTAKFTVTGTLTIS